ncbi:hypothetical protein B0J13DRAFT_645050 [Dactylonectria estremocensis]|uniref:Uncharacterized protein n=1 Tax=Dactylonectria estremocensis TaxID=1079267 RepID=A0A9P9E3B6_9HYPO|nr:hypothetical protein B0J13DRAFT_645050 [Dactylonectria estremocensis]
MGSPIDAPWRPVLGSALGKDAQTSRDIGTQGGSHQTQPQIYYADGQAQLHLRRLDGCLARLSSFSWLSTPSSRPTLRCLAQFQPSAPGKYLRRPTGFRCLLARPSRQWIAPMGHREARYPHLDRLSLELGDGVAAGICAGCREGCVAKRSKRGRQDATKSLLIHQDGKDVLCCRSKQVLARSLPSPRYCTTGWSHVLGPGWHPSGACTGTKCVGAAGKRSMGLAPGGLDPNCRQCSPPQDVDDLHTAWHDFRGHHQRASTLGKGLDRDGLIWLCQKKQFASRAGICAKAEFNAPRIRQYTIEFRHGGSTLDHQQANGRQIGCLQGRATNTERERDDMPTRVGTLPGRGPVELFEMASEGTKAGPQVKSSLAAWGYDGTLARASPSSNLSQLLWNLGRAPTVRSRGTTPSAMQEDSMDGRGEGGSRRGYSPLAALQTAQREQG